ncbi:MAG TPA: hypothetical protein VNS63_19420, partial [Blastocatellia bacterium]|nr:hypothetical protein [Blastocatellia bacterium]
MSQSRSTTLIVESSKRIMVLLVVSALTRGVVASQGAGAQRTRKSATVSALNGVPAPRDVIGFTPGDDRKLASWAQIVEYFKK